MKKLKIIIIISILLIIVILISLTSHSNIDTIIGNFQKKYNNEEKEFLFNNEFNVNEMIGLNLHITNLKSNELEKTIDLLKSANINMVRIDLKSTEIIKNDKIDISKYKSKIETLSKNNIKILAIVDANFITDLQNEEKLKIYEQYLEIIKNSLDKFIDYYEIINEPNVKYTTEDDFEFYQKLIKTTKSKLNNDKIFIGGTMQENDNNFNKKILEKDLLKNIDNFSFHYYNLKPDIYEYKNYIKKEINLLNDYGGFNKILLSETGMPSINRINGEQGQAETILKILIVLNNENINNKIIYNFRDTKDQKDEYAKDYYESNYGIVNYYFEEKKAILCLRNYEKNFSNSKFIGQITRDNLLINIYDKDGKPKIIAWATDTNKPVTIDYLGFKASDLYGKEIENTNGKLEITTSPVYIDNVSTKNFYQAISKSITTGYKEFDEKFANEINKVPELKTKISNLNIFAESLKNVNTLDENIANLKMKEHFSLGNTIIKAYDDGRLDIEYVKLSSILDYLNTIGNAYEDLITVSAKTRITDLTSITNEVNEAKSIIENNTDIDIVYPNKIYKFSKDLLDTSSYVLGLDEENDIKTGLINSKATHAKYLADWSEEFSKIYIKGWLQEKVNSIKDENSKVYSKNEQLKSNTKINTKYNSLIENLNNLPSQTTSITKDTINSIYNQQYELINTIVDEFNNKKLNISESEYQTLVTELLNISEQYKELFNAYITEDDIENSTIENNINNVIDRYNENKDIDMTMCAELINNIKEIYNDKIQTEETSYNYLNKRRIQNTCTIISKMLENKIKETAQQEAQKIGIAYNIDPSTLTNKDVIAQIKLPNSKSSIESNPNNEKYTFIENGTKNITINIRGYKYNYNIKVTNIDKTPPQITGIEQSGKYKESVTPQITDENLSEVKLIKDGQEVENYKQNTAITQEGIYQLKATDKAGNETSINFVIAYPEDEKYKIENNTIKNIKGETSVETLKGKLQVDEKYTIKRKDTEIQNSENIATGDILETESGNKYTLIVRGDLNKDGKVDIKDLVKMRKFLLLGNNLDESEKMAADTNIDGKEISIKDLVKMRIILLTQ